MKKETLVFGCIGLFVLLYSYTAISKILDYDLFVFQMRRAPLPLMQLIAPVLGRVIPLIELILAIGLLIDRIRIRALIASVGLLIIFEIYIIGMLLSGHVLPCTCGGIISKMSWKEHLLFNAIFISIGLATLFQIKKIHFPGAIIVSAKK